MIDCCYHFFGLNVTLQRFNPFFQETAMIFLSTLGNNKKAVYVLDNWLKAVSIAGTFLS